MGARKTIFEFTEEDSKRIILNFKRTLNTSISIKADEIADGEAYMLCGISKTFKLPVMWYEPPYGYSYFMETNEFIDHYKKSAKILGANRAKDITIGSPHPAFE